MGRDPRYVVPDSLQHVVDRTFQNRYFWVPSEELNRLFLGVLGRAQRIHGMVLCGVVVASNHYHLLLRPRDAEHLADFMGYLKTNLSKEIGTRLRGWKGRSFDGRYRAVTVSDEPSAQIRVLRYLLAHGVKEDLVEKVLDWPGVHCAQALLSGRPLVGVWHDRTEEARACDSPGEDEQKAAQFFDSEERVELSPIPCWQTLDESARRRAARELVEDIDREAAQRRQASGVRVKGVAAVLAMDPEYRPDEVPSSPKPRFHTTDPQVLAKLLEIWRHVLRAFREASEALYSGDRSAVFPEGTFPPSLPFVPFEASTLAGIRDGPV